MAKILSIETSTDLCSVALAFDGKLVASRKSDVPRTHASLTAVFCDEVIREAGIKASELDAVCISEGPGSYTGLRVGLSTAKGICFGSGARLLSICSLDVLAAMAVTAKENACSNCSDIQNIIPMTDARRMEVYTAVYDCRAKRLTPVEARIIEEGSFAEYIEKGVIFIGDGVDKCREILSGDSVRFISCQPEANAMAALAEKEYAASAWRDTAYFEPFYLKDFQVTVSKKKAFLPESLTE